MRKENILQVQLASLRELQAATGEELRPLFFAERTLLPSGLRPPAWIEDFKVLLSYPFTL